MCRTTVPAPARFGRLRHSDEDARSLAGLALQHFQPFWLRSRELGHHSSQSRVLRSVCAYILKRSISQKCANPKPPKLCKFADLTRQSPSGCGAVGRGVT